MATLLSENRRPQFFKPYSVRYSEKHTFTLLELLNRETSVGTAVVEGRGVKTMVATKLVANLHERKKHVGAYMYRDIGGPF